MMIHIHRATQYDDSVFRRLLASDWTDAALYYYSRHCNFDEKSMEESDLVRAWREALKSSMPESFREGVQLLRENAAFMGEDVYVVDGGIQHAIHVGHKVCKSYSIVSRTGGSCWCAKCSREVASEELADDVRG